MYVISTGVKWATFKYVFFGWTGPDYYGLVGLFDTKEEAEAARQY